MFPHFTVPSNGKFPHLLRILLPVLAVAWLRSPRFAGRHGGGKRACRSLSRCWMNHQFIFNLSILHMFEILDVIDSYHHLDSPFSAITKFGFMDFGISHQFCRQLGATFDLLLKTEALLGADCRPRMLPLLAMALVSCKIPAESWWWDVSHPTFWYIWYMSKILLLFLEVEANWRRNSE